MADLDPRIISYAIGALLVAGGGYGIARMLKGFQQRTDSSQQAPLHAALREGNFYKAGRLALEAGDWQSAAKHFTKAGRDLDAARALRKGEDWSQAAELFEQAGDFPSAATCYRKLGKASAERRMLEAAQDWSAAAKLVEGAGDLHEAAALWLKAGKREQAAAAFARVGDTVQAAQLRAELLEERQAFAEAAAQWLLVPDWQRALTCYEHAHDDEGIDSMLIRLGRRETAADRHAEAGRYDLAAQLYEQLGMFRKAALHFQKAGETERAIHCLSLDGDKLAVVKLRSALGHTDEALRVAQTVSASDAGFIESAQIAATLLLERGDHAQAARILLQLLDAPMEPDRKLAAGRQCAELFLELGDGDRGRQVLDRLLGLFTPGSEDEAWCLDMQRRLARLPVPTNAGMPALLANRSPSRPSHKAEMGDHTETFDEGGDVEKMMTQAYPGGRTDQPARLPIPGVLPEIAAGWPNGVPRALASRYRELERIGQGGNGVVFSARDQMLDRMVVLKFMIQGTMPSEMARRYFLREVKLAAGLNHPNIVHIYDMGNTDDVLWYAMEYVDGLPLTSYLNTGVPIRDHVFLVSVLEQLCGALDYAHKQGLIHRDIKPDNVLVAADGTVKLLDFGLARVLDDGFGEQSVLAGTPFYMAPEQLDGSPVDHRADIYALGVVLFRMVTGHLPFTEGNIFVAHATEPVPDPRIHNPGLSAGVVAVIERCMAKKAAARYGNCRQIALDVRNELYGNVS